jgi:hypothetical protein
MPMAPFTDIDFNSRIGAIIQVGFALGVGNANVPSNQASGSHMSCLYYINKIRVFKGLQPLPGLDYTGFQGALNDLAALVS